MGAYLGWQETILNFAATCLFATVLDGSTVVRRDQTTKTILQNTLNGVRCPPTGTEQYNSCVPAGMDNIGISIWKSGTFNQLLARQVRAVLASHWKENNMQRPATAKSGPSRLKPGHGRLQVSGSRLV